MENENNSQDDILVIEESTQRAIITWLKNNVIAPAYKELQEEKNQE